MLQNSPYLGFGIPELVRTCPQDTQASELFEFHQGSREQGSKTSNRNDTFLNPRGEKIDNKEIH